MEALSVKEIVNAVNGELLCGDEATLIHSISTNSNNLEKNSLFVPIKGERVDGHTFIEDAFHNGAIACFTSNEITLNKDYVYIKVENTLDALQALGSYYRSKFSIPVIGITGSVGKTTTKEMVSAALETKYNVIKTIGNMNSQVGLPQMMMKFEKEHQIAVIEMGISEEGEMARLTAIARPELAIVTNIGVSHIAQLKTRENIRKEKLNIINAFDSSSVLFINGTDHLLKEISDYKKQVKNEKQEEMLPDYNKNSQLCDTIDLSQTTRDKLLASDVIVFGNSEGAMYQAEDIKTLNGGTKFTLRVRHRDDYKEDKVVDGDGEEIILSVLGMHNVYNALVALAVANYFKIPASVAKIGLEKYKPIAMRGEIKKARGITIIDDTYNASPDSMKSGLSVLQQLEGVKRRVAVLADIRELGEFSKQCHYEVGEFIAKEPIDELVTIGSEANYIAQGVNDHNKDIITHSFMSNGEAIDYLKASLQVGDALLIKGSNSMRTNEIVKALCEYNE